MKRTLLAAGLIAPMALPAHTEECDDAQDQATLTECAEQAYADSDAELNARYGDIEQRLGDDADTRHLLVEAERAWVAFRDAECTFAASGVAGSSAYPMVYAMCLEDLTQTRIGQIEQYLNCDEGDMSCPLPPAE